MYLTLSCLSGCGMAINRLCRFNVFCDKLESSGDSDLRIWLCSIAKNLFYTHQQKQSRITPEESFDHYEAEEKLFVQMREDKETALQIHKVLHDLKEPYKEIFSLRIFGELSFKEMAWDSTKAEVYEDTDVSHYLWYMGEDAKEEYIHK